MLTMPQLSDITQQFYSQFCGTDLRTLSSGVHFICTPARDETLPGFGCKYAIYVLCREDACVVAYAPQYADLMHTLMGRDAQKILAALRATFTMKEMQLMILQQECVNDFGNARILLPSDYPLYEAFFRKAYPVADPAGWLREYFTEKTSKGYFAGYVHQGSLVSVCDAPNMPYMADAIQHTGIMTLAEHRRRGYARATAALAAHHLIAMDICPQWECSSNNAASIALAESIGYAKYATAYILEA